MVFSYSYSRQKLKRFARHALSNARGGQARSKLIRQVYAEHAREMQQVFSYLDLKEREALAGLLRNLGRAAEEHLARSRARGRRAEPRDRRE